MALTIRAAILEAASGLEGAGVASPLVDAQLIAAHLLGCGRAELVFRGDDAVPEGWEEAIRRRMHREPLQWILGSAPMGELELAVGPGVFIPRPETEQLASWAIGELPALGPQPVVVDLCTGSGALALAIAHVCPGSTVTAVELDPTALGYARRNAERLGLEVRLVQGDATDAELLADLRGTVDLVVSNPPYVPEGTVDQPEVGLDPHHAVFGGEDGMSVISPMSRLIARLLRPGGVVGVEHDDNTGPQVRRALGEAGLRNPVTRADLAGRDRFTTACR